MNNQPSTQKLLIGWASADITPDKPVLLAGQFFTRVSEGVMDPITVTALALESLTDGKPSGQAVMLSCDVVSIPDGLLNAVRAQSQKILPELDPQNVFLNATHTHAGPELRMEQDTLRTGGGNVPPPIGVSREELNVMDPAAYVAFAVQRIAETVQKAWQNRAPGGISFGLGQAVVGRNRRISYYNGSARMYGPTCDKEFSHIEGYEDHSLNLLCTYDPNKTLTGMIVNLACPSQVSETSYKLSADFWHDTRLELRKRFGEKLFILPQCSAAGDQSPHILINKPAEARMLRLKGLTANTPEKLDSNLGAPEALRSEIAQRIADGVSAVLPAVAREIDYAPAFGHRVEAIELARRNLTQKDVADALVEAEKHRVQYEAMLRDLEEHPEKKKEPRWYTKITAEFRLMKWNEGVATRFELQKRQPATPFEVHVIRLGQTAIATNPFELYVDYGMQIKAISPAIQTFVVQLAGTGTYLPTARAIAGQSYGALPASTPIGQEGGRELVQKTLDAINKVWE